jgi:hypothetical protein
MRSRSFFIKVATPRQFVTCAVGNIDRHGAQMTTWAHVLAAGWAGREMLATVQLFAGPELGMGFVAGSEEAKSFGGKYEGSGPDLVCSAWADEAFVSLAKGNRIRWI